MQDSNKIPILEIKQQVLTGKHPSLRELQIKLKTKRLLLKQSLAYLCQCCYWT